MRYGIVVATLAFCSSFTIGSAGFACSSLARHDRLSGRVVTDGLLQLTGLNIIPNQMPEFSEMADPAPPFVNADGSVEIYGSGPYFLHYRNWFDFSHAGPYEMKCIELLYPNGMTTDDPNVIPWDIRKFHIQTATNTPYDLIIAGSMSPSKGRAIPVWPEDNISRRLFFYRLTKVGAWIRDLLPIILQDETTWIGHSYGGNLLQLNESAPGTIDLKRADPVYLFYEKVTASLKALTTTEIFVRQMLDSEHPSGGETKIIEIPTIPVPATHRTIGGDLIEGPRPIQIKLEGRTYFIVGFSSNDFTTDFYTINYAWSPSIFGPYTVARTPDRSDFLDLGAELKSRFNLSWAGRPSFYKAVDGHYHMLFHAVEKRNYPGHDFKHWPKDEKLKYFFRAIFDARIHFVMNHGAPEIKLDVD
jgi:hypothetical protein